MAYILTNCFGHICAVMLGLYVDYSSSTMGHICTLWQAEFFRVYANNMKCMYASTCYHIVDCSELICGIYNDINVLYLHRETAW